MQDNEAGGIARNLGEGGVSEAERIGQLAEAGEQMVERLRRTAFLPGAEKGLKVRVGLQRPPSFWDARQTGSGWLSRTGGFQRLRRLRRDGG